MRSLTYNLKPITYYLILLLLVSCAGSQKKDKKERTITVTIEPQRYFTEAIAGDKFKVVSMVPKGNSPESYDPTPKQLVSLGESEAYFRIGYIGFEVSWMKRLIENAPNTKVFDLSEGVDLIRDAGHTHGDHVHEGGIDPHIWNSTVNAKIIANNILSALCSLDQTNEAYYKTRHDSLIHRINEVDHTIRQILKEDADQSFMIYHPALSYFARDYGLHQICIEEGGKTPSPKQLKELIKTSTSENVHIIFVQPEFDKRNAEIIAQQAGAKIVDVNPLSYDWEKEIIHIAKSLAATSPTASPQPSPKERE